jgi:hypothetical protein
VNARVFAALIRRNEQNHRKRTEEVRKIFRALKEEYTQIIAIFMKNINKALFKLDRRDPVSNSEKVRKKLSKELKGLNDALITMKVRRYLHTDPEGTTQFLWKKTNKGGRGTSLRDPCTECPERSY